MKRFIIYFVLASLIFFGLSSPVFSQSRFTSGVDQEQALTIANQVATQKSNYGDTGLEGISIDVADLIDEGYVNWGNLEFDEAKEKFERALKLEPHDQSIANLIYEVEQAKINYENKITRIEKDIIEQKRVLESEQAWVIEEPTKSAKQIPLKQPKVHRLRQAAEEKKVAIDFSDAEPSKVFEYLTEESGINIVMDEAAVSAAGNITIHLKNVSVLQALESILRTKGLGYRFEDDFIWISSEQNLAQETMVTRIYHLSQGLATFTTFTTFDTVTVNNLRSDNDVVIGQDGKKKDDASSSASGAETYEGVKIGGATGVAGKLTKTIKDVLKEVVTWPEGSRIFLDNRTSTLIVRNTPSNLAMIEQALEVLDVNPPQVMIEARFVEIGVDDLYSLGMKLNAEVSAYGAGTYHSYPFNKGENNKHIDPFSNMTPYNLGFGVLNFQQFSTVLSAIEQTGSSNTLSSPKITTVSGQEAVIKVVKEYRYPTKYDIQTYEELSGDTARTFYVSVPSEFKTRDIGIMLKVTPNIGTDGKTINLTLIPEVSEFDIDKDMYNYGTAAQPYLQPFFSVRNCTASIVVNNNDTVVMGGLMKETVSKTVDRVPVLGHIPLVGRLFSRKSDNKVKRNLLIFVTARIIAPTGQKVENDTGSM